MYKLLKGKGNNMNIIVENTETKASMIVGKLTMKIIDVLEKQEGMVFGSGEDEINVRDEWNTSISNETADMLLSLAMKIEKPVRNQSKKQSNKTVDALDVLLGLATYN